MIVSTIGFTTRSISILLVLLLCGLISGCGASGTGPSDAEARLTGLSAPALPASPQTEIEILDIELCQKQNSLAEATINGFTSFLPPDSILCRARPDLLRLFDGFGVLFGTLSVACSFPGPAQAALPVFSVGGAALSIVSFGLKGVSCEDSEAKLSPAQEETVEAKVCQMMGKTYRKGLGPVEKSRCE